MLIACVGPDMWRARQKARSLLQAFREKHDPQGYSTEILVSFSFQDVLKQLGSPSLFTKKRCIRCDGLLSNLKIADIRLLAKKIEEGANETILLSVEQESISEKTKQVFSDKTLVLYEFRILSFDTFFRWCMEYSKQAVPQEKVQLIARMCAGDTWKAVQELDKCIADPQAEVLDAYVDESGVFVATEAFVRNQAWREEVEKNESEAFLNMCLSQIRAAIRVRDGATQGLHPFVVKKMSNIKPLNLEKRLRSVLRAQQQQRSGLGTTDEVLTSLR
ncbi:hypothetical protein IT408_03060 [Candidatus Uhrbacteria bacterium]|nr:hypothetical protein [Candidatus Uhrbacteria bacterium]